jgi:hypothetical protein
MCQEYVEHNVHNFIMLIIPQGSVSVDAHNCLHYMLFSTQEYAHCSVLIRHGLIILQENA